MSNNSNQIKTHRRDYYTFYNTGMTYTFDPEKRRINEFTNKESNLLEIHLDILRHRRDKGMCILDNRGVEIKAY